MQNATKAWSAALWLALAAAASGTAMADSCIGNCGTDFGSNGDITLPPTGTPFYQWITTNGGASGGGSLSPSPSSVGGSETNGSAFTYSPVVAPAGAQLTFYFNFITSDGNKFPDYAWSQLYNTVGGGLVATLITAETAPSGNVVPAQGAGFPPISATLTPASVPIMPGDTWTHLGPWSGLCFQGGTADQGCGHTGWIKASYTIQNAGIYDLTMGVTNVIDDKYDSGLAFGDVRVNNIPIGQAPLPAALPMFFAGLGALGTLACRRRRAAQIGAP
jgi:hypothetical protein